MHIFNSEKVKGINELISEVFDITSSNRWKRLRNFSSKFFLNQSFKNLTLKCFNEKKTNRHLKKLERINIFKAF